MTRRLECEDGSLTAYVVVLAATVVLVAGLVVDGGRLLAARRDAQHAAQSAARAAAQAIDLAALRDGQVRLSPADADAAARAWLGDHGYTGSVTVTGDTVQVRVRRTVPLRLLSAAGLPARTVEAAEQARAVQGVTEGDP